MTKDAQTILVAILTKIIKLFANVRQIGKDLSVIFKTLILLVLLKRKSILIYYTTHDLHHKNYFLVTE